MRFDILRMELKGRTGTSGGSYEDSISVNTKIKFSIAKTVQICNGLALLLSQVVFKYRLNHQLQTTQGESQNITDS